ncbi:hypothetical protein BGU14_17250 [Clostridioides difficile]|nr:hypothetical protein BGU14_17250 [Clostridioides difficile]
MLGLVGSVCGVSKPGVGIRGVASAKVMGRGGCAALEGRGIQKRGAGVRVPPPLPNKKDLKKVGC